MKGHVAHAGFPEVAYGENADKLVRAGYKVRLKLDSDTASMRRSTTHAFSLCSL